MREAALAVVIQYRVFFEIPRSVNACYRDTLGLATIVLGSANPKEKLGWYIFC